MAQHSCEPPHPTPFATDLLVSDPPVLWALGARACFLCSIAQGGPCLGPPGAATIQTLNYRGLRQPVQKRDENLISPWRFISEPIQLILYSRKWLTVFAGWPRGLGSSHSLSVGGRAAWIALGELGSHLKKGWALFWKQPTTPVQVPSQPRPKSPLVCNSQYSPQSNLCCVELAHYPIYYYINY